MLNIIVASSDADQLDELVNGACEIGQQMNPRVRMDVKLATSMQQLEQKKNSHTALVIVSDALTGQDQDINAVVTYAKSLAVQVQPPACIVVSDRMELYRTIQTIKRCELLIVDNSTNYVDQCVQLARRLDIIPDDPTAPPEGPSSPAETRAPPSPGPAISSTGPKTKYALLEVELPRDPNFGLVYLELHEESGKIWKDQIQPLRLDKSELEELIKDSNILKTNLSKWQQDPVKWKRHYDEWHAVYRKLGERVARLLWGSKSFSAYYNNGRGFAKDNIRIRFNLEEPWFDGLWEALSAEQDSRNLILENTLTRRVILQNKLEQFGNGETQIDAEGGTLNVLVIQSDVSHDSVPNGPDDPLWRRYWASYKGTLPSLPHLEQEVKALRDLKKLYGKSAGNLRINVEVLPHKSAPPGKKWSLAQKVEDHLADVSARYDVVHFAGHALFAEGPVKSDDRGYLVFSGFPQPEAVPIARVASWLKNAGVQLVYLSCRRSSAASAALEFSRCDIPMAIGFHWDLDDAKAPVFARQFYQELLATKLKVCPAVSNARRKLFQEYDKGDPIWASPVLIAQPKDWAAIEEVLKIAAREKQIARKPVARPAKARPAASPESRPAA